MSIPYNKLPCFYRIMHPICGWFQSHTGWLETQHKWSQSDESMFGDWRFLWGLHSDYQGLEGKEFHGSWSFRGK